MNTIRTIAVFLTALMVLSGCSKSAGPDREIASFTFLDQNGQAFGSGQLEDTVWIADFVFTNCETVCPPMTSEMASLQKEFAADGLDVQFVSFSVDPEVDTPQKLAAYAGQFTDDQTNWHFLTGYSAQEISEFALENFQTIIQKPATSDQVIHGTNFYLMAPGSRLVSEFNYVDENYLHDLKKTVQRYLK